MNYLEGAALWPDQHGGVRVNSGVAILTQSSNIAINITMQQRGLPIAYAVTVGNQAQIGMSEIGLALLRDARVTALGLHIEGVGDLRAFEALAAEARRLGKGIIALKSWPLAASAGGHFIAYRLACGRCCGGRCVIGAAGHWASALAARNGGSFGAVKSDWAAFEPSYRFAFLFGGAKPA